VTRQESNGRSNNLPAGYTPHTPPNSTGERKAEALRLVYGDEVNQFADLRLPSGPDPHPVVVLVHGGGWQSMYHLDLMDAMAEDLTERGYATWNIEYRAVGLAGGEWPGTFHDVAGALDYLRELAPVYGLDLARVVTLGHSAGGHLALWLAARHRLPTDSPLRTTDNPLDLAGVLGLAAAPDLRKVWADPERRFSAIVEQLLGGTPSEVPERYRQGSPEQLLPFGVPQILIHGTEDRSVPLEFSHAYVASARKAGDDVSLVELQGVDHFAVLYPQHAAWQAVVRALER